MGVSSPGEEQFWQRDGRCSRGGTRANIDCSVKWDFNSDASRAGKNKFPHALRIFAKGIVSRILQHQTAEVSLRSEIAAGNATVSNGVIPFCRIERVVAFVTDIRDRKSV